MYSETHGAGQMTQYYKQQQQDALVSKSPVVRL